MAYPLSGEVSSGQPTAAAHYNNLRSDALRFGQAASDAVNLGELLSTYQSGIKLEYLAVNKLRIPASVSAPAAVVISGVPLIATGNVDLAEGSKPSGAAATYYVFAVQSAGSQTFTLDLSTSPSEATGRRRIGSFYWDGTTILRDSITTRAGAELAGLLNLEGVQACGGRLTLETGKPAVVANNGSGTLYFTPYLGDRLGLYASGHGWRVRQFSEVSLSLAALDANKNYDIFVYDLGGVLTLEAVEWSAAITRAVSLVRQDGVLVKSGEPEKRYLGTIRTVAAGVCEDSYNRRFVWNMYNRVVRGAMKSNSTSHTYNSSTQRPWNNDEEATKVGFVSGQAEDSLFIAVSALLYTSSASVAARIHGWVDYGESYAGENMGYMNTKATGSNRIGWARFMTAQEGYHTLMITESVAGSATGTYELGEVSLMVMG